MPRAAGVVGLTLCPGKKDRAAATGAWDRDLDTDLDAVAGWGARAVVSLVEDHELSLLGVEALGREVRRRKMVWFHLPIRDAGVPDRDFERRWRSAGPELRARLLAGERILVHCRGGLGRTGTIAARLLVELGASPEDAIRSARRARPGAIENDRQEDYVRSFADRDASGDDRLSYEDRVAGCLLAGACGDALGAPVEFLDLEQIRRRYGPRGIRDFAPAYGRAGAITDDTQMTLFTAEGCLRAWGRGTEKGICHPPSVVSHAYLRWLRTQEETPSEGQSAGMDGWLIGLKQLWSRRAPGNTCLSALRACRRFGQEAENDSKGCGGVMRVAPAGLAGFSGGAEGAFDIGCDVARLTHAHPSGYLAAGFQAAVIALLPRAPSWTRPSTGLRPS